MSKKQMNFKTRGMNRDLSVSAFNPDFSFENINLRLQTNEGNTLLSWVNERGTKEIQKRDVSYTDYWTKDDERSDTLPDDPEDWVHHRIANLTDSNLLFEGVIIGHAVLNHQLVLFTTELGKGIKWPDHIYVCHYSNTDKTLMTVRELYHGRLNFSVNHPLETHVSYESDHVQKVYWTDGFNQPRLINIAADNDHIALWKKDSSDYSTDTWFDFIPATNGVDSVSVVNHPDSGGTFAPGVIQYCITYFNKYGQQSNVVWATPIHYLAHSDRGESPEGKTGNVFTITITGADTDFDYIRLYSVQRTSIDVEPIVKVLDDLKITGSSLTFTDNGTIGYSIDPTELLYAGGREITVLTMSSKDDTLFMGNIVEQHLDVQKIQDYFTSARPTLSFTTANSPKSLSVPSNTGFYFYKGTLDKSNKEISTFKGGETYRLGIQLQKVTGEWTDPIFLDDVKNNVYPALSEGSVLLPYGTGSLNFSTFADSSSPYYIPDFYTVYKKVRTVVAYPDIAHRRVLCQGVLNPTVFNVEDRVTNSPFAQASWYFRPFGGGTPSSEVLTTATYHAYSDISMHTELSNGSLSISEEVFVYDDREYIEITISESTESSWEGQTYYIITPFRLSTAMPLYTRTGDTLTLVDDVWLSISSGSRPKSVEDATATQSSPSSGSVDTDCDSYFRDRGLYSNVYILYALVPDGSITSILSRGYLTVRRDGADFNYPFRAFKASGLYRIGPPPAFSDGDGYTAYVFVSDREWPDPSSNEYLDDLRIVIRQLSEPDPETEARTAITSQLSTSMRETFDHRLYYSKPAWSVNPTDPDATEETEPVPDACVLKFRFIYEGVTFDCTATFDSLVSADDAQTSGSSVMSGHYSSIYAQSDYEASGSGARQIEIHGSKNIYDSVFSAKQTSLSSNTQFFIDQSIVTLNSPDIDFDPLLQGYGAEGLSLRIVGAIPITGNASYHKITTRSAMLESYHNYHDWHIHRFGNGERDYYIMYGDGEGTGRLVSDYLWNDVEVINNPDEEDKIHTDDIYDYLVYPWHRSSSLNNDFRSTDVASSLLGTKKESTLLYSNTSYYIEDMVEIDNISSQFHFTENDFLINLRLDNPTEGSSFSSINYYPNIDKILYNREGYNPIVYGTVLSRDENSSLTSPVSMKYKSTSHVVLALGDTLLPSGSGYGAYSNSEEGTYFWGDDASSFTQEDIPLPWENEENSHAFLWLGELYRKNPIDFGNVKDEQWIPCCEPQDLTPSVSLHSLQWLYGDTYYQRYDCLKTYPFTHEDTNQLIEILSFMCETRVNIDGRYDRNRGQMDNTNMSPQNFNLLNLAYSQKDNFFSYKILDEDRRANHHYPNLIAYGKTKISNADIDLWTNISLGSTLEMDGNKGDVKKLITWNSQIFCFQDKGIGQVLYNENTALTTREGVPVEIANSEKVQGKRYISDGIGCSDKWSVVSTPNGVYFIDSNEKNIYCLGSQLDNLSQNNGFSSWCKQNLPAGNVEWTPDNPVNFASFYDVQNKEVMFVNKYHALTWSEKLGVFTSFYDYNGTSGFTNLDDTGLWMKGNPSLEPYVTSSGLWKHQAGDYCRFFGENKPFSMTLVGNPEPLTDKIFTNMEFRACVDGEGNTVTGSDNVARYMPLLPFDYIESWNEYQHGVATLQTKFSHPMHQHHLKDDTATLKRKFRIWRCDIPRDNAGSETGNVFTSVFDNTFLNPPRKTHPNDRMRNPWIYLKMYKGATVDEVTEDWMGREVITHHSLPRTEVHDMVMTYYV